jgi:hypothetical protein
MWSHLAEQVPIAARSRIVVDDLPAATAFFVVLGLKLQGEGRSRAVGWTAWSGWWASGRKSRWCRPRTATDARADRVSRSVRAGPATRTRARTPRASAISHSQSTTSTLSSLACEPAARSSLASWSATNTASDSATSVTRRGSSRAGRADRLRVRPAANRLASVSGDPGARFSCGKGQAFR